MNQAKFLDKLVSDLHTVGVREGGILLVHASFKSLGQVPGGVESVIRGLLSAIGPEGTLLLPALSYETVTPKNPVFDIKTTPSCVGIIPEFFRLRPGTKRSMHPTHSVSALGPLSEGLLSPHIQDSTPCGPNSPFNHLANFKGQILMLGCGLRPNTCMHAIEEIAQAPYLFNPPIFYTLIDQHGQKTKKAYKPHNFTNIIQRYDRVESILGDPDLRTGEVLNANIHLIEANALKKAALNCLHINPWFFVDVIRQAA
jgi:aminoglycoside 3-N-acetyltransferase